MLYQKCYYRDLIPKGKTENGVDFAQIIQTYIEALAADGIPYCSDRPFIYTGTQGSAANKSKFINSPIGEKTLHDVGKDIATLLGLKDPESYTGHTFRRYN